MRKALTVDELIKELKQFSDQGKGGAEVIVIPSQAAVTSVHGPVGISGSENDAVMLYAKESRN